MPIAIRIIIMCFLLLALGAGQSFSIAATGPLSKQEDGALQVWNEKAKFYLVIAVDQTGVPKTNIPFTLTDAKLVVQRFEQLGYRPLVEQQLIGSLANRNHVNAALKQIRSLPETASVIVYYSGHGVASPNDKDVSLQLSGQDDLDYGVGFKVADLIESAKDRTYLGELHLIIDACFSGTGAFSGALTLKDVGAKTTIFTSSSTTQNSFPITLDDGTKLSAFTHALLQALGPDWHKTDDNGDGILRFGELSLYSSNQLKKWHRRKKVPHLMQPQLIGGHHEEVVLAYDRNKVQRWQSSTREALTLVALERKLIPPMKAIVTGEPETPEIPQDAQLLAKQIPSTSEDPYVLGIKAQAEGRLDDANALFAKAEALAEEHKEKLAKIYLARGRNMTYAGNYKDALPWYQKRVALQPTKDPALLNEFGGAWRRAGKYREALLFYQEALELRKQTLHANNPELAISLNNMAVLHSNQGQYTEAERLYQHAIQIDEVVLGPNHPGLATDLNNLGSLYKKQGQLAMAEPLIQRALTIRKAVLGNNHPDVAQSFNTLAELYRAQGKYAEAKPLYQYALHISETTLGREHPSVAILLNNLALLYMEQGQYAESEPLYQRALAINKKSLGPEHPLVANNYNNLALLYIEQGKYTEAEPLFQRAIEIDQVALGINHPNLATDLNNLGSLYKKQGQLAKAKCLYRQALKIDETALGPDHPNVARDVNNLAGLYVLQGKYTKAESLYLRALGIVEKALGSQHPHVAASLNNLANLYHSQGKHAEAEPLYQRALKIDEDALGPNHPSVANRLYNLAGLYTAQGQFAQADPLYQRAYWIMKASLGLEHPNTRMVLSNYAEFLMQAELREKITPLIPDLKTAFPGIFAKEAEATAE